MLLNHLHLSFGYHFSYSINPIHIGTNIDMRTSSGAINRVLVETTVGSPCDHIWACQESNDDDVMDIVL